MNAYKKALHYLLCTIIAIPHSTAFACTGIRLHTDDNSIIYARTLEWRKNLNPYAIVIPHHTDYIGTSTDNRPGLNWTTKHTIVGITIGKRPHLIDGINACGLGVGLFSFRDDVEYAAPTSNTTYDLAPWELVTYFLSTCASVDEVIQKVVTINVVPVFLEDVDEVPPLHYIVHDSYGNCIVLEHTHQNIKIYDNPFGVMTNSPNFDWHMTNLHAYLHPAFDDHKTSHVNLLKNLHETYALGLPSDFSSPSRFIRAAIYTLCTPTPSDGLSGVMHAFHILNQFDIPKGSFRTNQHDYYTYTHWTSAANLTEKKYYFRTYENQRIRMIDMHTLSTCEEIIWLPMNETEDILDITPNSCIQHSE